MKNEWKFLCTLGDCEWKCCSLSFGHLHLPIAIARHKRFSRPRIDLSPGIWQSNAAEIGDLSGNPARREKAQIGAKIPTSSASPDNEWKKLYCQTRSPTGLIVSSVTWLWTNKV
jgi:hypothetical protein